MMADWWRYAWHLATLDFGEWAWVVATIILATTTTKKILCGLCAGISYSFHFTSGLTWAFTFYFTFRTHTHTQTHSHPNTNTLSVYMYIYKHKCMWWADFKSVFYISVSFRCKRKCLLATTNSQCQWQFDMNIPEQRGTQRQRKADSSLLEGLRNSCGYHLPPLGVWACINRFFRQLLLVKCHNWV